MIWYLSMLAVLPLLILPQWRELKAEGWAALWSPKVRSWWVIMGASLATYVYQSVGFYWMICIMGAGLVLSHPMTGWQRFLGWIFIAMSCLNLGYMLTLQNVLSVSWTLEVLQRHQMALSWAMILTLIVWGGNHWFRGSRFFRGADGNDDADSVEPAPREP